MPRRGRTAGTRNKATNCAKCGSTKRTNYHGRVEQAIAGVTPDGDEYTRIVLQRTSCGDCGQARIDKTFVP